MSFEKLLISHRVILFLYGTIDQPIDRFSENAVKELKNYKVNFFSVDVTSDLQLRTQVQAYSGWNKFPQLFVDGEFIGGSFIINEFLRSGELSRILKRQINYNQINTSSQLYNTSQNMSAIWSIRVSPDTSFVVSGAADGTIKIWDAHSTKISKVIKGHLGWVNCIAITPDNKFIISGSSDSTIRVWDVESGSEHFVLHGHERWVNGLAVTPDGKKIVSVSSDRTIRMWDLSSRSQIFSSSKIHEGCIWSVCTTLDGKYIITSSADRKIMLWDMKSLQHKSTINGHNGIVTFVKQKGIEDHFLSASYDASMMEWDYEGNLVQKYEGHSERIWSIASTRNGQRVVTVGADKKAIIWSTRKMEKQELILPDAPIACDISPDGNVLFIGFRSGKLQRSDLSNVK